jgi:pimeloyl-ACP methyl ester carboxylesterase
MQELVVKNKEIELFVQTFGDKNNPAILLISGSAGQAILWNKTLCENLSKAGYFIIRFDNRDTGQSSSAIYEEQPYTLEDMAEDAFNILDYFKINKAHIVGQSMGGYIAQVMAIRKPERLLTLTLLMTTINSMVLRGIKGLSKLPGHDLETIQNISRIYHIKRHSLEDRIKSLTDIMELFNGNSAPFPYKELYQLSKESYARAKNNRAVRNHRLSVQHSPANRTEELRNLSIPTLIIHGKADPIIKVEHAYYTKEHIPQAKLLIIDKMGHILSSIFIKTVEKALVEHFK